MAMTRMSWTGQCLPRPCSKAMAVAKRLPKQALPRGNVGDRSERERVEEDADSQRHGDRGHIGFAAEVGVGFFGVLGHGLEPG